MRAKRRTRWLAILAMLPLPALGQSMDLDWHTIDGGGVMESSGGDFRLSGTIAQPDAGLMSGGEYRLTGGFWAVSAPACACTGDVDRDGKRDGKDIQAFVGCYLVGGASCACADVAASGFIDMEDVSAFVSALLSSAACSGSN